MSDLRALAQKTHAIYQRHGKAFDTQRAKTLIERKWIERFIERLPQNGSVLDLGCGAAEPIAAHLISQGFAVTGVDFSAEMLAMARARFPEASWIEADMRDFDLAHRFDGIIAWNSFFHLPPEDQWIALQRISDHLHEGGVFMVTVGPQAGEVSGHVDGAEVYHASLSPEDYVETCEKTGLEVVDFTPEDPECDFQTVMTALKK